MIPQTFPSEYLTATGKTRAIVYSLPSVTGLTAWIDYIPVKGLASENTAVENTYAADGYILVKSLDAIPGLTPFKDYIPVFENVAFTKPWSTDEGGYIPMYGLFAVLNLFANGEQGVWYDPSDLTTLFQDSAGTTPVTAVEQPVGLMLDKSKGLTLGPELVTNGDGSGTPALSGSPMGFFQSAGLASGGTFNIRSTVTASSCNARLQVTATEIGKQFIVEYDINVPSTFSNVSARQTIGGVTTTIKAISERNTVVRVSYISSVSVGLGDRPILLEFANNTSTTDTISIDNISVREIPGNHATQATSGNRPTLSARVNQLVGTATLATQSVTVRATQQTLTFTGSGSVTLSGTATGTYTAGTYTFTPTAGSLTLTVSGTVNSADLRESNAGVGLPSYQRVNTSTDYDTAGFPLYLKFNGTSSSMATNSINFTATDKMTVWAGVRKLSDAGNGTIVELSVAADTNSGAFFLRGPSGAQPNYQFVSRGTITASTTAIGIPAPITNVLTGIGDISGDSAILRVNGTQAASSSADQGIGNYGNYPLYIGARAGTSLFLNGTLYSLIARGAQSTATQISSAETWVNTKTKAY